MPLQDWDKLPDETAKQFELFCIYRDMPASHRTLLAVYRVIYPHAKGPSSAAVRDCERFQWEKRAANYDAYLDNMRRSAIEEQERRTIESEGKKKREFKSYELQLAEQGFRQVSQILSVTMFDPDASQDLTQPVKPRLPANLIVAAATMMRAASLLGRKSLGLQDDDGGEDITPDTFKDLYFRTRGQLERSLPAGAMPSIPAEVAVKPTIEDKNNGGLNGHGLIVGERERP